MNYLKLVSDRGGGGDVIAPPAVSVLIFVTQKPNDNFSLAFLLTFMQKKNLDFHIEILSCTTGCPRRNCPE